MPSKKRLASSPRKPTARRKSSAEETLEKLRQSEERLRLSQAIGQIGSYEWDLATDTAAISEEMGRIYGLPAGQASVAMSRWRKLLEPEDLARVEARLKDFFARRDTAPSNEFRIHRESDALLRWIESRGRIEYDGQGRPVRIIGVNIDVTDRKLAQLQVQQSEQQFRTIVETANEGVWFIDREAQTLYANERLAQMLGYTIDELYQLGPLELCFPEDVDAARERIRRNYEGLSEQFDFRFRRKNGTELQVLLGTSPVRDGEGNILGAVGMFTDISARRRYERELGQSLALLQAVNEGTSNLVFAKDCESRITYGNQAFFDAIGKKPQQVLGRSDAEFLADPEQARTVRENDLLVIGGKKAIAVEERANLPEGDRVYASNKFPQFDADGNVIGLIGVATDITEHKALQQKLALRYREFEALAVSTPGFLFTNLPNGENDYSSRYFYEYTGAPGGSAAGDGWAKYLHPDDLGRGAAHWQECVQTGKMFEDQLRFRRHDGEYRWFAVRNTPLRDTQGRILKWYGIAVDTHKEKSAQDALAASEERFRLAMKATNDAVWDWDLVTNKIVWNPAIETVFGYDLTNITGDASWWYVRIHPDDSERVISRVHGVIAGTEEHWQDQYRFRRADGTYADVHDRGSVMRDNGGHAVRMIGAMADITERKRAEQERSYLAAIVESSQDAVIGKDLNGTITSWNRAAERLYGYSAAEMVGKSILMLIPPEFQAEEERILERIRGGESTQHYETVRIAKNGERIDVSLSVSPIVDANGRILGASKIARDIREQKRTRAALVQSEKLASVGRLSMTIAHEINNPLEAVTNLLYLINAESGLSDAGRSYLQMAENELARVSHIAKQTLGFYRDSSVPAPVSLERLARDIVQIYTSRISAKGVQVRVEQRGRDKVILSAGDLRQVVSNLLSNSLDAIPTGGAIIIRVHGLRTGARITIGDDGPGIPASLRHKIFEPFFTTKRDVGTGLGLWVTSQLLFKQGGRLSMRSSTEGTTGTVFSLFVPELTSRGVEVHLSAPVRATA
jgi:PAS domain S-box-containing protein